MDRNLQERIRALAGRPQSIEVLQELAVLCQRHSLDTSNTPFQGWINSLEEGTKKQQLESLNQIASLGSAALFLLPTLLNSLLVPAKFRRRPILEIIEKLGPAAVPGLVERYWQGTSRATPWLIFALGSLPGTKESFEVLSHAFESPQSDVQLKAVIAFRSCPNYLREIELRLRPLISKDQNNLSVHAIRSLQALNCQSDAYLESLTSALIESKHRLVRRAAAEAVPLFKERIPEIQSTLIEALNDVEDVGLAAVESFEFVDSLSENQLARITALLNCENVETRLNTVKAIGKIGVAARRLFPNIIAQFNREQFWLPQSSVETLIAIARDDPECEAALIALLRNEQQEMRRYAAAALGQFNSSPLILSELTRLLADPCPQVRGAAIKSMGELEAPLTLSAEQLGRALLSSEFRESFEAARAIRKFSGDISPAFQHLLSLLHHLNEGLRREAVLSLMSYPESATEVIPEFLSLLDREHRTSVLLALLECLVKLAGDSVLVQTAILARRDHPNSSVSEKAKLLSKSWRS